MKKLRISNAPAAGTDWAHVNAFTDAQIERMAKAHKEHPAASEADWAGAIVGLPSLKTPVNANFDVDVADWFKAQGRGYQTRMNAVLRRYMDAHRKAG